MSTYPRNLFDKVWSAHAVRELANGQTQLLIGTHLIHEVTSPQAFAMLKDLGLKVAMPQRTFATVDHIVPTDQRTEPFSDPLADAMIKALRKNCAEHGITYFDLASRPGRALSTSLGPEQGITCSPARRSRAAIRTRARMAHLARSHSASARVRCATCWRPRQWRSAS